MELLCESFFNASNSLNSFLLLRLYAYTQSSNNSKQLPKKKKKKRDIDPMKLPIIIIIQP